LKVSIFLKSYFEKFNINLHLDEEYHIYYRRGTKWIALGTFQQAMKDDDECEWDMSDDGIPQLHLLIVSSKLGFISQI
jgi:hypothetical protein